MNKRQFNAGYRNSEVYDEILLPHYYSGKEDLELVRDHLGTHLGPPPTTGQDEVLELGCGSGRLTTLLAPYAAELLATDKSEDMISAVRQRFPGISTRCADTESVVRTLHAEGKGNNFDLIGSFWSLNYPLLECFEETTENGVVSSNNFEDGLARARSLLHDLIALLAPAGRLIILFFDADTEEQRLVTKLWERIAPFPGTGRDYTWRLLHDALIKAELEGRGTFYHARLPGVALARSLTAAREWLLTGHLNNYSELCTDPEVHSAIDTFAGEHRRADGTVCIPSAVHFVEFRAESDRSRFVPAKESTDKKG